MPDAALPSLLVTRTHIANGKPNGGRHSFAAVDHGDDNDIAFVIASGKQLELVDHNLHLRSTTLFADAFPNTVHREGNIIAVAVDNSTYRIAAAYYDHVAIWSKTSNNTYKVHSTFSTGFDVACLDLTGDTLLVGGGALALYSLNTSSGLPLWSRTWEDRQADGVVEVQLSANGIYGAIRKDATLVVTILHLKAETSNPKPRRVSEPWHPRSVRKCRWINNVSDETNSLALATETSDGIIRIWRCFPDEPHYFVLWHTVNAGEGADVAIANLWYHDAHEQQYKLFSALSSGLVKLITIKHLDGPPTRAGSSTATSRKDFHLSRRQLSTLKFATVHVSGEQVSILSMSKTAALSLLRFRGGLDLTLSTFLPWKYARLRPKQKITSIKASESAPYLFSTGERGECIFWQARRIDTRTVFLDAIAMYNPYLDSAPMWSTIAPEGNFAVVVTTQDVLLLSLRKDKVTRQDVDIPEFPQFRHILALRLDMSNDGSLFLIAVTDASVVFVWRIGEAEVTLVARSNSQWTAHRAAIMPEAASSAARIAIMDDAGGLGIGSILLERRHASYRDVRRINARHVKTERVCISSNNYVAALGFCDGQRVLQILNTQSSLFTNGLEYSIGLRSEDNIVDMSFVNTPDGLPLLLVTYDHRVDVIGQRRLDYYQENSMWAVVTSTRLNSPFAITCACFTYGGSMAVAANNQLHLLSRNYKMAGTSLQGDFVQDVRDHNCALPDYHPQLLIQCLLAGKQHLVQEILDKLYAAYRHAIASDATFQYKPLPLQDYLETTIRPAKQGGDVLYPDLLAGEARPFPDIMQSRSTEEQDAFVAYLHQKGLPLLSDSEVAHLIVVISTSTQVQAQSRALDNNGARFFFSLKSFAATYRTPTPPQSRSSSPGPPPTLNGDVARIPQLRFRDVLWGFHSESQEILLNVCHEVCGRPMLWQDARSFCLSLWLRSSDALAEQVESIARNEFLQAEDKDPTACSLFYFALRKKRLVQGLWRQAGFHQERAVMMKFLMNDFEEPRWKSAAIKNAYALMGKHRFHYAAAFFLLGGSLKDCIGVCLRQLKDWQLAVLLARVYDGDDGQCFKALLHDSIIPMAFAKGYRRLASWAFWKLKRRDLSIQVLVTPFTDLIPSMGNPLVTEVGLPGQEDPSLLLLYRELRDWSVQTLRGSFSITPSRETQFVTHISQAFCRMGCHVLALDLVTSWRFTSAREVIRAFTAPTEIQSNGTASSAKFGEPEPHPHSSSSGARPATHHRRHSSTFQLKRRSTIIMDVPSTLPSRSVSPEPHDPADDHAKASVVHQNATEHQAFKKILKEVKAPPPEFDMSSFGF